MTGYNMNEKDYIKIMEKISEDVLHTSYLNLVEQNWTIDGEMLDKICRKLVNISTEHNREMPINVLKELYEVKRIILG